MANSKPTTSLPVLTVEQRAAASAKALDARRKRAIFKHEISLGKYKPAEAIEFARADDVLGRMKVSQFIGAWPGFGKAKTIELMGLLKIADSRRMRGLGVHQLSALVDKLSS